MKMMAKNAEDRYQSMFGLVADLQHCLEQLRSGPTSALFELGADDFSDQFQIPQKLYGRERETATLLHAFERISQGNLELVLVTGYAGIGKSKAVDSPIE